MYRASFLCTLSLGVLVAACGGSDVGAVVDDGGTPFDTGSTGSTGSTGTIGDGATANDGHVTDAGVALDAAPPSCASTCAVGEGCTTDKNCVSLACSVAGKCATGATDGKADFGESDVDCGGTSTDSAPTCAIGKKCAADTDCKTAACGADLLCAASGATDGKVNFGETDIDCGGSTSDMAPTCATDKKCVNDTDCKSAACGANLLCAASGAVDGKADFGESDVDCGGATSDMAPKCADGKKCVNKADCGGAGSVCNLSNICAQPTNTDGIKDGTETDVDCGGSAPTNAAKCAATKACGADADCAPARAYLGINGVCADSKKCASSPSCRHSDGAYTCGPTKDQDCCAAPAVPGQAAKIDAYKITAGRMREFTASLNGDVTGWYLSHRANLPSAVKNQLDPYLDAVTGTTRDVILPRDLHSYPWGVDYQLGGAIYTGNYPSGSQGCYVGTKAGAGGGGAEGAHTYDNGAAEGDQRGYSTGYLDRLPINCVTYVMLATFCAWDGGRLATRAEHQSIGYSGTPTGQPATTWIWGNAPTAGGWSRTDDQTIVGPATTGFATNSAACPSCDVQHANWQWNYEHIRLIANDDGGNAAFYPALIVGMPVRDVAVNQAYYSNDTSYFISPPGRFPYDSYPGGTNLAIKTHYDVMGSMFEMNEPSGSTYASISASSTFYCDTNADCITNACNAGTHRCTGAGSEMGNYWTGGSWEGHALKGGSNQPMMTKYGKATGRCARD